MTKRTTIQIDEQLLARATIEEALRRAAEVAENEHEEHAARQRAYLKSLAACCNLEVLASDEMWR
jgi:hypothetical protein